MEALSLHDLAVTFCFAAGSGLGDKESGAKFCVSTTLECDFRSGVPLGLSRYDDVGKLVVLLFQLGLFANPGETKGGAFREDFFPASNFGEKAMLFIDAFPKSLNFPFEVEAGGDLEEGEGAGIGELCWSNISFSF